ncbi:aromatic acid exporter family protein [Bacillus sp. B15-48]|uniref:aromatic acid exporter family protein n=1 Tax=Bacillus sp. B15-48 TaxID=1548601 RepID=UPI00193F28FA|nr:aromatic acid exporter family protein [Bacillus sp. B15-48]MBM4761977.1 hypothetical protein [Bacillus sp. B15-48]
MKIPKRFRFIGGRIVKTGLAVFITALICHLLNWPAMFAVITAIVTIEPTAADSIKKAFVRFPASAIGAGFSVLATFLFGDRPISYAFVAVATIISCHKLKLHDGTLVATLTGVAMISTVHDEYLSSFFIRLGTTCTGLIVSSLVNFLVMPPKYSLTISQGIRTLYMMAGDILNKRGTEILQEQASDKELRNTFYHLVQEIEKTETLCTYQKREWKFHRPKRIEIQNFLYEYKKLNILRQVTYHIGNLIYLPSHHFTLGPSKCNVIMDTIHSIRSIYYDPNFTIKKRHYENIDTMKELFSAQKSFMKIEMAKSEHLQYFSSETVVIYELLSIHELTEELSKTKILQLKRLKRKSGSLIENEREMSYHD